METSIIDYTCTVDELKGVPREKVAATLAEVGFNEEGQAAPITSLSGGWKMKLALARAMLQEAQVCDIRGIWHRSGSRLLLRTISVSFFRFGIFFLYFCWVLSMKNRCDYVTPRCARFA